MEVCLSLCVQTTDKRERKEREKASYIYREKHTLKHFYETQLLAMILTFLGHFCCFVM